MTAEQKFIHKYIPYILLAGIIYAAVALRLVSADFQVLFDLDSWWFYRHALGIYENNFAPPTWDTASHFPPGRPVSYALGWPYTIAIAYALTEPFHALNLMKFSGLFVTVFAGLSAIPAYFIGRFVTNKWGGLVTALFAVFSVRFLTMSLAGHPDSDAAVVFYSLLVVLTMFYALKNGDKLRYDNARVFFRSLSVYLPYLAPVLLAYWLFAVNWGPGLYIYFIFMLFIPTLILFRVLEAKIFSHEKGSFHLIHQKIRENRHTIFPIFIIGLFVELISVIFSQWPYSIPPLHDRLLHSLDFTQAGMTELSLIAALFVMVGAIVGFSVSKLKGLLIGISIGIVISAFLLSSGANGETLLVFRSVTELQPVDIFSFSGQVTATRLVGTGSMVLGTVGMFGVLLFKLFTRRVVTSLEYFVLFWVVSSFFLLTFGARFSLQLSIASAVGAGLVAGNLAQFFRGKKVHIRSVPLYALIAGLIMIQTYDGFNNVYGLGEYSELSAEWVEALTWLNENAAKDAMTITWWTHGHAVSGFTNLRVHTDGAFCDSGCIPYDHNDRIIDAGKILITTDEGEALDLLRKYRGLSLQECGVVTNEYGSMISSNACENASELYLIISQEMIDEYHLIHYFGTYDYEIDAGKPRFSAYQYYLLDREDENGNLVFGDGRITLERRGNGFIPLMEAQPGMDGRPVISEFVFHDEEGRLQRMDFSDSEVIARRLLWLAPSGDYVVLMDSITKNNILGRLFFLQGQDLEQFDLVFENQEVKIYRVQL